MMDPFAQASYNSGRCSECGGTDGGHYVTCSLINDYEEVCTSCWLAVSNNGECGCSK